MDNNKQTYKLTDSEFIEAYRVSKCNCALTAKYIREKYNMPYSRQAVYKRSKNFPELTQETIILFADGCEAGLINFANDESNDIRLRTRIYIHLLNKLNKMLTRVQGYDVPKAKTKKWFTTSL